MELLREPTSELSGRTVFSKNEYMNSTRLAKILTEHENVANRDLSISVLKDKTVKTKACMYTKDNAMFMDYGITPYDLAVMDSVYTLFAAGNKCFTAKTLLKVMSGNLQQKATEKKLKTVEASLMKLTQIRVRIDCTKELRVRKVIGPQEELILDDYLLPLKVVTIKKADGSSASEFVLACCPVLYQYAEKNRQIISVPIELLAAPKIPDTEQNILLKRQLIKRIEMIRSGSVTRTISYEWIDNDGSTKGLLKTLGVDRSTNLFWRNKKMEVHGYVIKILEAFREYGYIKDFKVIKDGQAVAGVEVEPVNSKR